MNVEIKNIEELRDSRIMYEKEIPKFGYIFILILFMTMILILIWSKKTPKKYEILASGTVTNESTNYVMCTYTGEVESCNLQEGELVEKGDILLSIKSTDYDLQEEQLLINRDAFETKIDKYRQLVQSIKNDENLFDASNPEDSLYFSIYEGYKSLVNQNMIDTSLYANYGYTDEQIEAELEKNQGKLSQIYYDSISNAESAIKEAELSISSIDAQLSALQSGKNEYVVRATETGMLHLLSDVKKGMMVQTTMPMATITPQNSEIILDAFVSTADMARIHEGDEAKITIDGLIQNVYGSISGKIRGIDSDVSTREDRNGTIQGFKIRISMDTDYLISTKGEKIDIKNGMTGVARITYDKITYFDYALEKMGIKLQ